MRIMHLVNHCGKANGNVNVSVDLACMQARMGHAVGYSCAKGDFIGLLENSCVQVFHVAEPHRSLGGFLAANLQLFKAIRNFHPDILHVHMAAQSVLLQPYRLFGYKIVTTLHNEFDRSAWLMGLAARVVTVGQTGYDAMLRRGVPKKKIRMVLNGSVGSPRLPPTYRPAELAHPAILSVCGIHPRKGVADLLQAFAIVRQKFPAARLYIAGEGPMLEAYKALACSLGIAGTAQFLGFCDDPREYLATADIFVLASHADPGPLVIAEASNGGCAIVATDVDGIPAMLNGGEAGLLVPPRQPERLAMAIMQLLGDPALLADYAARAKQNASHFTVERVCRDLDSIYAELIKTP